MQEQTNKVDINLKSLLAVGAHFGTKKADWDPRMSPFIFGRRNGVYIIDLEQTVQFWRKARKAIVKTVAEGGTVLFVGTKPQTRERVREQAERCGRSYVENKWQGGTLTNFKVLRASIKRLTDLEKLVESAESGKAKLVKKEIGSLKKQIDKDIKAFGGVRNLKKLPDLIFITDAVKEDLAVEESLKSAIPIVAITDTNVNPHKITHIIPANDDATGTITLFTRAVADAILEGKLLNEARVRAQVKEVAVQDTSIEAEILARAEENEKSRVTNDAKPILVERKNKPSRK